MADTETTTDQESQVSTGTAGTETTTTDDPSNGSTTAGENESGTDDLPEWARKQIEKANKEAASYRVQLRQVQDQFKDAKTEAELEAVLKPLTEQLNQSESRTRDLERQLVIYKHGLDEDLAEFITGDNPEAWEEQAKKLAERVASANPGHFDRKGDLAGRKGTGQKSDIDPRETAKRIVARNRY